jgi:hypothetical protein
VVESKMAIISFKYSVGSLIAKEWFTLKSRWHLLNKYCQWFYGSYKLALDDKKSEQSETNIMDETLKFFVQVHHQQFNVSQWSTCGGC